MDRKLLLVVFLSFGTMFVLNKYVFVSSPSVQNGPVALQGQVNPGGAYRLPTPEDLAQPAQLDVSFSDQKISDTERVTTVQTPLAQFVFSSFGGQLAEISYSKHTGALNKPLKALFKRTFHERDRTNFLVALGDQTPYFYKLSKHEQTPEGHCLVYTAQTPEWEITKQFVIGNDHYKVDLNITVTPRRSDVTVQPRLFVSSPFLPQLEYNMLSGVVPTKKQDAVSSVTLDKAVSQAWVLPTLFGSQNKYFAHVLVADQNQFVQRGYFKREKHAGHESLTAILEGPRVTKTETFDLSFYMGPKSLEELNDVDSRLEGLLSFGWLSRISKLLLRGLVILYDYVHNYGWAIILLTLLIKLLLLPFAFKAQKIRRDMEKHGPATAALRKKYAHDQQRMNQELMEYYRAHNVSPLAPLGAILIQLLTPIIFFALYRLLSGYIGLYHAPFFGWITDLSSKDPYYILPVITGLVFMWMPMPGTGKGGSSLLPYILATGLTFLFASFPAGIMLYLFVNMGVSLLEARFVQGR